VETALWINHRFTEVKGFNGATTFLSWKHLHRFWR